jgi:hypothetical protein
MKARNLIATLVIVAFLIGGYLGGLFPKIGAGPGPGGRAGAGPEDSAQPPDPRGRAARLAANAEPDDDERPVLHLHIEGRELFVLSEADGAGVARPTTLDEIAKLARLAKGNSEGIRVRVSRRPSSKAAVEVELRDALVDAGVPEDAIDWQDGPRP